VSPLFYSTLTIVLMRAFGAREHIIKRTSIIIFFIGLCLGVLGSSVLTKLSSSFQIQLEIRDLGLTLTQTPFNLSAEKNSDFRPESLPSIAALLAKVPPLQSLDLSRTTVKNLEPLKGLTALQSLDLSGTTVSNLQPLKGLTALQWLDLSGTTVSNLEPLKGLTALQSLNLTGTPVNNLEPLKGLTELQIIPP
jgi:Leucine-rich repeat (LRR) protein